MSIFSKTCLDSESIKDIIINKIDAKFEKKHSTQSNIQITTKVQTLKGICKGIIEYCFKCGKSKSETRRKIKQVFNSIIEKSSIYQPANIYDEIEGYLDNRFSDRKTLADEIYLKISDQLEKMPEFDFKALRSVLKYLDV